MAGVEVLRDHCLNCSDGKTAGDTITSSKYLKNDVPYCRISSDVSDDSGIGGTNGYIGPKYACSDTTLLTSPATTASTLSPCSTSVRSANHLPSVDFKLPPSILDNSVPPSQNGSVQRGLSRMDSHMSSCTVDTEQGEAVASEQPEKAKRGRDRTHKESVSEKEYHKQKQNQYKQSRRRHFTDPVDFDGILRIIGGCSWWQIWVYFLISLQQIPHAMFNLSIIFMMIQPPHWCYIDDLYNTHDHKDGQTYVWTVDEIKNISIPAVSYDGQPPKFSSCEYYVRDNYHTLAHMPFLNASEMVTLNATRRQCSNWTYDRSEMRETIVTQWNLVCADNLRRAHAHLAYALGYLFGCLLSGLSSDRFGRKPTVIGFGVLASMFGIILPYSTYFPVFLLIRFLSAVCNEAADLAAYVLCMEITGTKHRAVVGSFVQAPWALGYTLLALVAWLTRDWRTIQIITAALHTVSVLLVCVLPESPRWLIVNNRVREAETIIRKACRMNKCTLPPDLELIKHAEQRRWVRRNERASMLHILKSRELVVRTTILIVVWVVTALIYYGLALNLSDQSGQNGEHQRMFSGDLFLHNAIAGAIELPVLIIVIFLLAAGRKRSQMACLVIGGVMMLGVVLSPKEITWLRLTFMLLGKAAAQAAFVILYIFSSEMYPTVIRNSVIGLCSMIARVGAGMAGYVSLLSDIALPTLPMIIFGVFSFVAGTLVIFLPETLNQPLPDTLQDAVLFLQPDHYGCQQGNQFSLNEDKDLMFAAQQVTLAIPNGTLKEPFKDSEQTCAS